jgi:hypothetical protein
MPNVELPKQRYKCSCCCRVLYDVRYCIPNCYNVKKDVENVPLVCFFTLWKKLSSDEWTDGIRQQ